MQELQSDDPCRLGSSTRILLQPVLNDTWFCKLKDERFLEQVSYENRAKDITITNFPDLEDELRSPRKKV